MYIFNLSYNFFKKSLKQAPYNRSYLRHASKAAASVQFLENKTQGSMLKDPLKDI